MHDCVHCLWINNKKDRPKKWHGMVPYIGFLPDKDFVGMTIFDDHNHFKNSFICVNGVNPFTNDNIDIKKNHDPKNIGSLLLGVEYFIKTMKEDYNINGADVFINSHYKYDYVKKKYFKEHPHAIVTIVDTPKKITKIFKDMEEYRKNFMLKENHQYIDYVNHNPIERKLEEYKGDTIIDLDNESCRSLFSLGRKNVLNYITSLMRPYINDFNAEKDNFYLVLNIEYINHDEISMKGMLKTDI